MKKAETTRLMILRKAFELIYAKGYRNTSVDEIIATTQVTKGAFYYHFKSKDAMGLAIINEILKPTLNGSIIEPLQSGSDPVESIYGLIRYLLLEDKFLRVEYGCPAANFTQEMTPWESKFRKVLEELTDEWVNVMVSALERGKERGVIRTDVVPQQVTLFIISGYWGIRNFGKLANSKTAYLPYLKELKNYLGSLK
ncbi:TetR/AcrR family transcriptional regulator [Sphingobacterium prati]|uniref:TetR/AcrR family transcriptional regulator n=1 Tax=Sphingobacterium prati TaxID=2737006 RepID=UPI00155642EF|nr:TetR/AcrR family transcriptional regulator [Sphingobacterium prati]NPE45948.1 TetR/AcrR family transcriptional regulator [Sphingobacterium prati]